MSLGSGLAIFGIALALGAGLFSCNKYDGLKNEGIRSEDRAKIKLEQEKTKQLELQLKLKGCH